MYQIIYVSNALKYTILYTGYLRKLIWYRVMVNFFMHNLNIDLVEKVKTYPTESIYIVRWTYT